MSTKRTASENTVRFPDGLLKPVGDFLMAQLKYLRLNRKHISSEDPFNDKARDLHNAAVDSEAEEQFEHARIVAIKAELNSKAKQIKKALYMVKKGKYGICEDCKKMIDTDRLAVFPEATLCINCKKQREK